VEAGGRLGLQNQRSIGSGYFKNIRQMAVSIKNLTVIIKAVI
jgi:hypothetical protein